MKCMTRELKPAVIVHVIPVSDDANLLDWTKYREVVSKLTNDIEYWTDSLYTDSAQNVKLHEDMSCEVWFLDAFNADRGLIRKILYGLAVHYKCKYSEIVHDITIIIN